MAGDSSDSRANRTLKQAAGMAAAAGAYKGLQLVWKQATGQAPPQGPDDQEAPLGRAIAWTLVMGAAITTARMIAVRYTSRLLPGGRKQGMTETAAAAIPDNPVRGLLSRSCMTSVRCRGSRGMPDLVVRGLYGVMWIEVKTFSLGAPFGFSALPVRLAPRLKASSHVPSAALWASPCPESGPPREKRATTRHNARQSRFPRLLARKD